MLEKRTYQSFEKKLYEKEKGLYPISAQLELTYRCNLNCIHCYCKGSERAGELTFLEWKAIIDQLHAAGTIWLTLTGGEPLLRKDFFEIYNYAREKGFLVTIFTNGMLLDNKSIQRLTKCIPYSVEISLTGVKAATFESITRLKGSFKEVVQNIKKLVAKDIPLVLKSVGLKQNKDEIVGIKRLAEKLLGKNKFKFDSFITPRLNGDQTPCLYRLSAQEIEEIENSDCDMQAQRESEFRKHSSFMREPGYKYNCNAWFKQFYITPYGRLRFCYLTDNYSTDLKSTSFRDGFYRVFPAILEEREKKVSKCTYCDLKEFCCHCPARAFLETGNEDKAVPYFCELARRKKENAEKVRNLS